MKIKKAIQDGNPDIGRIHAESSIRCHNEGLNMMKLAARLDAVAGKLKNMSNVKVMGKQLEGVAKTIGTTLKSMDLEKQSMTMENFSKNCEELDVQLGVMENALNVSTASSRPEDEVDSLMKQVADENNLDLADQFEDMGVGKGKVKTKVKDDEKMEEDDLEKRLAKLQSQ